MIRFLLIAAAVILSILLHILSMGFVGWLLGAKIQVVSLFSGPRLFGIKLFGVDFRVSCFPLGGYVKFHDGSSGKGGFENLHPAKRMLTSASGPLALLLFAGCLVGFAPAGRYFISGFGQFFTGAAMPLSTGQELLNRLHLMTSLSFAGLAGLIAAKLAAFNSLPFPVLNGGYVVLQAVQLIASISAKTVERINQVGFLIVLIIVSGWMVAIIYCLFH